MKEEDKEGKYSGVHEHDGKKQKKTMEESTVFIHILYMKISLKFRTVRTFHKVTFDNYIIFVFVFVVS